MDPIAFTIREACEAARIGRTSLYQALRQGELVARKHGRKTLIVADDLRRWVNQLPPMRVDEEFKSSAANERRILK